MDFIYYLHIKIGRNKACGYKLQPVHWFDFQAAGFWGN